MRFAVEAPSFREGARDELRVGESRVLYDLAQVREKADTSQVEHYTPNRAGHLRPAVVWMNVKEL